MEDGPAAKSNTWRSQKFLPASLPAAAVRPHPVVRLPFACPRCSRRSPCRRRVSEFAALALARRAKMAAGRCCLSSPLPLRESAQLCGHGSNGCLTHHRSRRQKKGAAAGRFNCALCRAKKVKFPVRQSAIFRTVPGRRRELNAWESGRQWDRRPLRCAFLTQKKRVASRIYPQHRCILVRSRVHQE